jgi:hypothetical protein
MRGGSGDKNHNCLLYHVFIFIENDPLATIHQAAKYWHGK